MGLPSSPYSFTRSSGFLLQLFEIILVLNVRWIGFSPGESLAYQSGVNKYIINIHIAEQPSIPVRLRDVPLQANTFTLYQPTIKLPRLDAIGFRLGVELRGIDTDVTHPVVTLDNNSISINYPCHSERAWWCAASTEG